MPPKKKVEEEPPNPEECLPTGFAIGCQVFWIGDSQYLDGAGCRIIRAQAGRLHAAGELVGHRNNDGVLMHVVETVEVEFDGLPQTCKVAIHQLGLTPPPMEDLRELSTGLQLPLTGRDVEAVWSAQGDFVKQARMLRELLPLEDFLDSELQRSVVVDLHIFCLAHALSLSLGSLQAATFVAIVQGLLATMRSEYKSSSSSAGAGVADCTPRPSSRPGTREDDRGKESPHSDSLVLCRKEFERLMLSHSVHDPPSYLQIFQGADVSLLSDFVSQTVFNHFLLYQYCISSACTVQTLPFTVSVEKPLLLPDLNTGLQKLSNSDLHSQEVAHTEDGELRQDTCTTGPEHEESRDIEALVQEKLREAEAVLESKLSAREATFLSQLAETKKVRQSSGTAQ